MPNRDNMIEMVAHQMMKGPKSGRVAASAETREAFRREYVELIDWVLNRIPRHSAAVGAVTVKCLIKYGKNPVEQWCRALKECQFRGINDPSHLLWKFLLNSQGRPTLEIYQKTVHASRAYMEGREIVSLKAAKSDIFKWEQNFCLPDGLTKPVLEEQHVSE